MKFYGIDLHSDSFYSVCIDEKNKEKAFKLELKKLELFKQELTKEDYLIVEASTNTFWFYEQVKDCVKDCIIIDPRTYSRTKKKTDKTDAKKLAQSLKYYVTMGKIEELSPVYVPNKEICQLRTMFTTYNMLIKEKTMVKNRIHSLFKQNGISFSKNNIFNKKFKKQINEIEIPEMAGFQVKLLWGQYDFLEQQIKEIKKKILKQGSIFKEEIKLLISIKGVSVFIAIAIMSDVADVTRFKTQKKFCSYLRTAPTIASSNHRTIIGPVNKCARKLSLNLLTQSYVHIKETKKFKEFYENKKQGKSKGKVRIAVIRKLLVSIYWMLKRKEKFFYYEKEKYQLKLKEYAAFLLNNNGELKEIA